MTPETWNPKDELLDLATELEAWVAWERLTGAVVLPRAPAGAGEALFGPPVDLSAPARAAQPAAARPPAAPRPSAPVSAPQAPRPSAGLPSRWAALAQSSEPGAALQRVRDELGDCRRCGLCEGRKNIVFGVGSPTASLVIVGEGPGAREDEQGEPFVGPAGEMLDRMLENVLELQRSEVYILNVVKCRPPNNRDPLPEEIAACRPFLDAQIAALEPKVILVLGRIAAQTLLGTTQGINALRGRWQLFGRGTPLMATFHPAYLLRQPADKKKTLEDLKLVKARLSGSA